MIFPKSDIRNRIISILSEDFPLSFRKISNKLNVSDRTLYRILNLMVEEGILIKEDGQYLINSEWLKNIEKLKEKIIKNYADSHLEQAKKQRVIALSKPMCSCNKNYAEGFCFVCNEPVCFECGEKTRMHYSCSEKCDSCENETIGKCANCLKDVCLNCSKEVWTHFSENCIKTHDKVVIGILEVDHQCWFADLSEKLDKPIVLNSFIDEQDTLLGTHSGRVTIQTTDKKMVINQLLKHKQIVEVKPLYTSKQLVLRTRALFNKSVDEFVRKNKSILLNPIRAEDTKERNLIISPSINEIRNLIRGLNEFGSCKIIACEEVGINRITSINSKEILSFVKMVDKSDLDNAVQKIRLMKKFYE